MRIILLLSGFLFLIATEVLRVYFIMPFPGSQQMNSIDIAYFLHVHINQLRAVGLLLIAFPASYYLRRSGKMPKIAIGIGLLVFLVIFYFFNYRFTADRMFLQPGKVAFSGYSETPFDQSNLIVGVTINGESRAYPIELIGYHHQVRDTVGGKPVMVTYCTVCRTGRVYAPEVDGTPERFRLVGMDHFNAMFEDSRTGSWWRQVSGEAIAGPLKGSYLKEVPSEQMALGAWINAHPGSLILLPDSTFSEKYEHLAEYDEGTVESELTGRDSASWKDKSWVVGLETGKVSKAYDWNLLSEKRVINDVLDGIPVLLVLEDDSLTFHAWDRDTLMFVLPDSTGMLTDLNTRSEWNWKGICENGPLTGERLKWLPAYQEFWHSWRTFHGSDVYEKE